MSAKAAQPATTHPVRRRPAGDAAQSRARRLAHAPLAARALLCVAALLLAAPAVLRAQSGRQRPPASASPTPGTQQRPRRATRPDDLPGQPSTPNAPSHPTPQPTAPAPNAPGQSPAGQGATEVDEDEVYKVESNLVPVSANVSDAAGAPITDLKLEDFELRVDGQPAAITDLARAETPVRLVLLFDNSASIRAARELEKQAAVRFFRAVMRPVDQAAIYSVESIFTLEHPLTSDVSRLVRTIERFGKPEGATRLFDAMAHAAEYLRTQPGRKVIVVVSDGADTVSDLSYDETLRRLLAADTQVFVVQTGIIENANLYDLPAVRRMEVFAQNTGGAVYQPKSTNDLDTAFTQIAADLSQQYVLSYYPSDDGRDGRFRVFQLRVRTRPNARVRARRGYYPRRRTAENLSAIPHGLASADPVLSLPPGASNVGPARAETAPAPAPTPANAAGTTASRGPAYGSKNMDPETSGTNARRDAEAEAPPTPRLNSLQLARVDHPPGDTGGDKPSAEERGHAPPAASPPGPGAADLQSRPQPSSTTNPNPDSNPDAAAGATRQPAAPDANPPSARNVGPPAPPTPEAQAAQPAPAPSQAARDADGQPATGSSAPPDGAAGRNPARAEPSKSAPGGSGKPAPQTYLVGNLNQRARSLPRPAYPDTARRARVVGLVVVEVTIDESGKVISARATAGPEMLRVAAVNAAKLARFEPVLVEGRAVRAAGIVNYNFTL